MKRALVVLVGVGLVAGVFGLNRIRSPQTGRPLLHVAPELEVDVQTVAPELRLIVRSVQAPGEVEAREEVDISSEVVAKILEMPVEEGDRVEHGDLLCRLDDAEYRARVQSREATVAKLQAQIVQAEADLEKAQRDCERQKQLSEANATSPIELADYHTAFLRSRAMLEMRRQELIEAHAALQSARDDLARTEIRAPIGGVVSQRFAKQGEVVVTGTMNNPGTRIMVISDLSSMQVRCRLNESDAPLVLPEQNVRIYLQSDSRQAIAGTVLRVATKGSKPVGRDVVTFETLVLIAGLDPRVKPGMTANVEIEVAERDGAVTVPVQAVVYRKRRELPEKLVARFDERRVEHDPTARPSLAEYAKLVFRVKDGKAEACLVETGISDATSVEILEGLAPADQVVTGPYRSLDQLKDGAPVKLQEKEATPSTQPAVVPAATDASAGRTASGSGDGSATRTDRTG